MKDTITKPKNVDYFQVPDELWQRIEHHFPKAPEPGTRGRPPAPARAALNGIWYVLWTGCQWKAIHRSWFGVCSSVIHERFQTWRKAGIFDQVLFAMVKFYAERLGIGWEWQSIDSGIRPAPLGGTQTGDNPTDRGKSGSKIHILVDENGAPLSLHITGANEHDKWSADDLLTGIVIERPDPEEVEQHLCADKGYDFDDVHEAVAERQYEPHIKHRRRRNEPIEEEQPIPDEERHPARRWVVERTISWLGKRRSIRVRWCKKDENWMALIKFACAHILFAMAFYG
jgi:putative transposase